MSAWTDPLWLAEAHEWIEEQWRGSVVASWARSTSTTSTRGRRSCACQPRAGTCTSRQTRCEPVGGGARHAARGAPTRLRAAATGRRPRTRVDAHGRRGHTRARDRGARARSDPLAGDPAALRRPASGPGDRCRRDARARCPGSPPVEAPCEIRGDARRPRRPAVRRPTTTSGECGSRSGDVRGAGRVRPAGDDSARRFPRRPGLRPRRPLPPARLGRRLRLTPVLHTGRHAGGRNSHGGSTTSRDRWTSSRSATRTSTRLLGSPRARTSPPRPRPQCDWAGSAARSTCTSAARRPPSLTCACECF